VTRGGPSVPSSPRFPRRNHEANDGAIGPSRNSRHATLSGMSAVGDALRLGERRGRHGVGRAAAGVSVRTCGSAWARTTPTSWGPGRRLGPAPGGTERFSGTLEVVVPDDDGTPTSFRQVVDVGARQSQRVTTYARPGSNTPISPCGCTTSRAVAGRGCHRLGAVALTSSAPGDPAGHAGRAAWGRDDPEPVRLQRPRQSGPGAATWSRSRGSTRAGASCPAAGTATTRPGRGPGHEQRRGHGDPGRPAGQALAEWVRAADTSSSRSGPTGSGSATASSARSCRASPTARIGSTTWGRSNPSPARTGRSPPRAPRR
jgi:hypothetical protein